MWELCSVSERAFACEKRCKPRQNRPINGNAMRVRTMHPSNARRSGLGAWQTKKQWQTPHFRTYSRRALFDLRQTLHDGRARRAHHKRCYPFFDLIHSFSARGQNVDFWLLSKNNTGRLPLRGILPVIRLYAKTFCNFIFYMHKSQSEHDILTLLLPPTTTSITFCFLFN